MKYQLGSLLLIIFALSCILPSSAQHAQNITDGKDADSRVRVGIQQADTNAAVADQKAVAAGQQAAQGQTQANIATRRVDTLQTEVANLDNYRAVDQTSVKFEVNRASLSKNAKTQLDQLVSNAPNVKDYIFVVKGYTDSAGGKNCNDLLSTKRASAVIRYLAVQHNVQPYRIYMIGLGENDPVDSNKTRAGRAKNRRADVSLMTNAAEGALTTVSNQ